MPIRIDKIDDGLPISVIVPLSKKRESFFYSFVLPMIEANNPNEIIINNDEGKATKKRNDGFKKSTEKYVFFCDDDILLPVNHLQKLLTAIEQNGIYGFAYSGYYGIVLDENNHPIGKNFEIPTIPYSYERLKRGNFISTMSLVRSEIFPGFDENITRLQDWDLWLTIASKGYEGVSVENNKFYAFYHDEGISTKNDSEIQAINNILKKHKIGV